MVSRMILILCSAKLLGFMTKSDGSTDDVCDFHNRLCIYICG